MLQGTYFKYTLHFHATCVQQSFSRMAVDKENLMVYNRLSRAQNTVIRPYTSHEKTLGVTFAGMLLGP